LSDGEAADVAVSGKSSPRVDTSVDIVRRVRVLA